MKRSRGVVALLAYLGLILGPAAMLAYFAFQLTGRERVEAEQGVRARLEAEAEALGRRMEAALAEAAARAEPWLAVSAEAAELRGAMGVVGYLTRDGLSYEIPLNEETGTASDEKEAALFDLAVRGGRSFELELNDPHRAQDAYAFYLPRIRDPVLRARLRFLSGRAALAAGRARLGRAVLAELFAEVPAGRTEEGLPIDLLAGAVLLSKQEAVTPRAFLHRLEAHMRSLTTPRLEYFLSLLAGDPDLEPERLRLEREAGLRKALEAAVDRNPEIRNDSDAVLDEAGLLLARGGGASLRLVRLEHVVWPSLEIEGYEAALVPGLAYLGEGSGTDRALRLIRVRTGNSRPVVAALRLKDLHHAERLQSVRRRQSTRIALVILLAGVTLAGGVALVLAFTRERRLARLRNQLLANVTHELRTPITSMRMFAEMLARDPLDEARTRRFGRLLRGESLRLSQLVENVLDFSRMGRVEQEMDREPVDMAAVLRRVAEAFAFRAEDRGADFQVEIPEGDLEAFTHAPSVERIVLNLLDNALKYGRSEGAEIRLRAEDAAGRLRVLVQDNGPGIPAKERERVFEPFYRVRYDDPSVRGSGLGLSIARRLARALGGDLVLESREGRGATFILELPVEAKT